MSEIPTDIFATARTIADQVSFGGYAQNALIIAKAILDERERSDWRDVSTAPRDGTPCIFYSPGNKRALNEYARDVILHIDGFSERWPKGRNQYPESPYTHWMPLPEPPQSQAEAEKQ